MDLSPWVSAQAPRRSWGGGEGDKTPTPQLHYGNDHSLGTLGETNYPVSSSMNMCICYVPITMSGWEGEDVSIPLRPTRQCLG